MPGAEFQGDAYLLPPVFSVPYVSALLFTIKVQFHDTEMVSNKTPFHQEPKPSLSGPRLPLFPLASPSLSLLCPHSLPPGPTQNLVSVLSATNAFASSACQAQPQRAGAQGSITGAFAFKVLILNS